MKSSPGDEIPYLKNTIYKLKRFFNQSFKPEAKPIFSGFEQATFQSFL